MTSGNPYDSPHPVAPLAKKGNQGTRRLDFGAMFKFPFTSPNWAMNLLYGSLCLLLGSFVVPQIIFNGYLWETLERLHRRERSDCPDFDFNRFNDYLMRGVWPFLVGLLLMAVMFVLLVPIMGCGFAGMGILGANDLPELGAVLMVATYLVGFVVMLLFHFMMMPFMIRAALAQDLGLAFNVAWWKEFLGLMWKELALGAVVLTGAAVVSYFVGLLLCCVGVYPALVVWMYASTHFVWQTYEMFLERGGTPVPLKAAPAK